MDSRIVHLYRCPLFEVVALAWQLELVEKFVSSLSDHCYFCYFVSHCSAGFGQVKDLLTADTGFVLVLTGIKRIHWLVAEVVVAI